jgi:hypothetical protein
MKELVGTGTNGKLYVSWTRVAVASGQHVHKNVETTAQAVNNRAGFCVDDGGDRLNVAELYKFLTFFRAQFFDQAIRGILLPGLDAPIEDLELGYGPIDAGLSV